MRAPAPAPPDATDEIGRGRRAFVLAFLAVFAVTGLAGIEFWPLTGWKLYIQVREPERTSWQILTVDEEGVEGIADFEALPIAYRKAHTLVRTFPDLDPSEREGVCAAWAAALHDHDPTVVGVRVYEARTRIPAGPDAPRLAPLGRDLVHQCEVAV